MSVFIGAVILGLLAANPVALALALASTSLLLHILAYSVLIAAPFALIGAALPKSEPALQPIPVRARKTYNCPDWSRYNRPFLGK